MPELSLLAAFLVGLLGGGHCVGMCGGIVGAVSMSLPRTEVPVRSRQRPPLWYLLGYNLGRITSYSLAGVLAGLLGASSFFVAHLLPVQQLLYGLASAMLIVLGLYLAGIWQGVTRLERIGAMLWRRLQPLGKCLLPVKSLPQVFLLGMLWGWLPCGLVYSVLVVAIATADPVQGGLLMLLFGLGTLPTLLAMGMAAVRLKNGLQQLWLRRLSGLLVMLFGMLGFYHMAQAG